MFCRSQTKINGSGSFFQNHQKTTRISESRLALGSTGCFVVVCGLPAKNGQIHRKMAVMVTLKKETLFQTRKEGWIVQPVFCIVDTGSCHHQLQGGANVPDWVGASWWPVPLSHKLPSVQTCKVKTENIEKKIKIQTCEKICKFRLARQQLRT